MNHKPLGCGVILIVLALGLANCGTTPRPAELVQVDQAMANKIAHQQASKAAPQAYKLSQKYYQLAEEAYEDGETDDCIYYSVMASIKFSTALEHANRLAAEDRKAKADDRTAAAKKQKLELEVQLADARKRTARMEEILALKGKLAAEKSRSKREQEKIRKKLEAEKKAAAERLAAERARLEEVEKEKEVQGLLASANSKIQRAESLDASKHDPTDLNSAKTYVSQSQTALSQKRFDHAKDLAKMAEDKANLAITQAQAEYAKTKKQTELLKEREALFNDATSISGLEVKQEKRGVVLTLYEMFAPRKAMVLPERADLLDKISDLAEKYIDYPIVVEGYTDSHGRDVDNLTLSQSRAQSVLDYLIQQKKLRFDRIKASGYGEAKPVADNSNAAGRAKNRRVEVIFLFR